MLQKKFNQVLLLLLLLVTVRSYGQVTLTGSTKINSGGSALYSAVSHCTTKSGICWSSSGTLTGGSGGGPAPAIAKAITPQSVPVNGSCSGPNSQTIDWPTVTTLTIGSVRVEDNCNSIAMLSVTIVPPLKSGVTLSPASENVNCGSAPGPLTASAPSGGDNTYTYTWQYSNDNSTWTTITTTSTGTYQPPVNNALYYRAIVNSYDYSTTSSVATITTVVPPFGPGTISNTLQTVIAGNTPGPFYCSLPTGGACVGPPAYTSVWKSSTDGVFYGSTGATSQNYTPGPLSVTTMFYRQDTYQQQTPQGILVTVAHSNIGTVTVYPPLAPGAIGAPVSGINIYSSAYISNAQYPSGDTCGGGDGYTWWQSSDGVNFTQIPGASNPDYTTPVLSAPEYYKREVSCGPATVTSNIVEVTVHAPLVPGTLTPGSLTIPSGTGPGLLTASGAYGGGCGGGYVYDWQWSQDYVDWHDAGASSPDYNPGPLTVSTYYRRAVSCGSDHLYTNIALVTVGAADQTTPSYMRTREILRPGIPDLTTAAGLTSPYDVHQHTEYMDGTGKLSERVDMQASPLQKDVVTMSVYDGMWRESVKYLPYTSATNDGNFKLNPLAEQQSYNSGLFPNDQAYYGQVDYETSPLGRVQASYSPGNSWVGAGRSVATQYTANAAAEGVIVWMIATTPGSIPTTSGVYGDGLLAKLVLTDENGNQVIQYKDRDGELILKKVQLAAVPGIDHTGWKCTYYVYDDLHRLRFEITPDGVQQYLGGTALSSVSDALCFRYEYDALGRMIIKKAPGLAESWMVYDGASRVVLTQDGHQRLTNQWLFCKYDQWNRAVATGLYTDASNTSQTAMQSYVNAHAPGLAETYTPTVAPGYTLNQSFPVVSDPTTVMSYSFYDDYAWGGLYGTAFTAKDNSYDGLFPGASNSAYPYTQAMTQSKQTVGKVTGGWSRVGSTASQGTVKASFFDDHERLIQTVQYNVSQGIDITTRQYSFTGRLLQSVLRHQLGGVSPQTHTVTDLMTYDAGGRVLTHTQSLSSVIKGQTLTRAAQTVTSNAYNESGQLKTLTLGNSVESLNYDYTVRGWLQGINRAYVNGGGSGNHFGFELGYDNPSGVAGGSYSNPDYTGNVAGTIWKSAGDGVARKFDYSYDRSDELGAAAFTQSTTGGAGTWNANTLDFSVSNIQYDLNGNLGQMSQKGWNQGTVGFIDELTYTYPHNALGNTSNQLQNVVDAVDNPNTTLGDFHYSATGKTASATDYTYDPAGNLLTDNNKSLTITYNYLGLPLHIAIGTKGTIDYLYNAAGTKLTKTATDNSVAGKTVTTTTTYINGFEYSSRTSVPMDPNNPDFALVPQEMLTSEGRIRYLTDVNNNVTGFAGDYFLRDNLGSVRMVLTDQQQVDIYPAATLEGTGQSTDPVAVEQNYYTINSGQIVSNSAATGITPYPNNNGNPPANNNPNCNDNSVIKQTDLSQKLYRINEANTPKTGLGITLKVMSGDRLDIFGKSYYAQLNSGGQPANVSMAITDIVSGLLGAPNSPAAEGISGAQMQTNTTGLVQPLNGFIGSHDNPNAETTPRAYINYVFFDEQFNYAGSGTSQVGGANAVKDHHTSDASMQGIVVPKNGYVYVFCSNESPVDVFFDNLQVVLTHGPILEETHYYPFGLSMAAISDKAYNLPTNRYKFQGKELNNQELADGSGLEEYDFEARNYDPQLGRWHNPDPNNQFASPYLAMANNWPRGKDPDGKYALIDDLIAGVVGAAINLGTELLSGQVHSFGQALGFAASGFAGGVAFEYGGPAASGFVTSFGNALVGGASIKDAFGQGVTGAFTGMIAGPIADVIGPGLSNVTQGLGQTLSRIATQLGTGAITGGLLGGGMSMLQGGSFGSGFGHGFVNGLAGAGIGLGVSAAFDAMHPNPFGGEPSDVLPSPPSSDPNNVPLAKTDEGSAAGSGSDPAADAPQTISTRAPEWGLAPGPRGFAIEQIIVDREYPGWIHTPQAPSVDATEPIFGDEVVQIKSTLNPNLNVTRAILKLADLNVGQKTLVIVTPPDFQILSWPRIQEVCNDYNINLVRLYH